MALNPDPTKQATAILFSCIKKEINHPELTFNGASVARVKEHKHLGLILEPNLSFEKQIYEKMIKGKKNIGIIKYHNRFLFFKTLNQIYKALVRSHLDYCDIIYHIPPIIHHQPLGTSLNYLVGKVEKIQYQAALAVTGTWQGSSRLKLYEELGWESLSKRCMRKRVFKIHKIVDRRTPSCLRDKMPPGRRNLANLACVFQKIKCRTDRHLNSFFPNAISIWNNIIQSFERLKNHLISLIRPKLRSTFDLHDSIYLRHLFQLRVGLSHLRYHKKRHNFADTLSDIRLCMRDVEDTSHFILFCPFFITHRETLTASINEILM